MSDDQAAETPISDHVARFWKYLEIETVRIVLDLKREVGHDALDGPTVYWDGSTFLDDVAKALVTERKENEKLKSQIMELNRIRPELEATARVAGYREGIDEIVKRLRALGVTVNIPY